MGNLNDEARNMKQGESSSKSGQKTQSSKRHTQTKNEIPKRNNEESFLGQFFRPIVNFIQNISSFVGFDSVFGIWMSILSVYLFSSVVKFLFAGGRPERRKKNKKAEATSE